MLRFRTALPLVALSALAAPGCGSYPLSEDEAFGVAALHVVTPKVEHDEEGGRDVTRHVYVIDGDVAGGSDVRLDRITGSAVVVWLAGRRVVVREHDGHVTADVTR